MLPVLSSVVYPVIIFEPQHNKTNKMTGASSEDSDQPGHPSSLIRVFTVGMKEPLVLSYPLSTNVQVILLGLSCCGSFSMFNVVLVLFTLLCFFHC